MESLIGTDEEGEGFGVGESSAVRDDETRTKVTSTSVGLEITTWKNERDVDLSRKTAKRKKGDQFEETRKRRQAKLTY